MPKKISNCPNCGMEIAYYPRENHRNGALKFCSRHCQCTYLGIHRPRRPINERFFEKVFKNPVTGCWEWQGAHGLDGHGQFVVEHKKVIASRFSWELVHGKIPEGMNVCHKCDNPPCVNPDHLFLGTQSDNIRDCVSKGRLNNWLAKKTICKHGHPFTPENTRYDMRGKRHCKECEFLRGRKVVSIANRRFGSDTPAEQPSLI